MPTVRSASLQDAAGAATAPLEAEEEAEARTPPPPCRRRERGRSTAAAAAAPPPQPRCASSSRRPPPPHSDAIRGGRGENQRKAAKRHKSKQRAGSSERGREAALARGCVPTSCPAARARVSLLCGDGGARRRTRGTARVAAARGLCGLEGFLQITTVSTVRYTASSAVAERFREMKGGGGGIARELIQKILLRRAAVRARLEHP